MSNKNNKANKNSTKMKTKHKFTLAILVASVVIFGGANAQTTVTTTGGTSGTLPKFSGTATIVNSQIQDNGTNVGVGAAGSYKLDVNGDINSAQGNAYRMAGNKILWYNSTATNNIFAGVGAGASISTGTNNTFMGNNAGTANTTGNQLTFVGFEAGKSNVGGHYNTGVGYQALLSNESGKYMTAIGYQSLYTYSTGSGGYEATNVACGYQSLYYSQAYGGCAFGFWAAKENTTGCATTAIGEEALRDNTTGNYNIGVGAAAGHHNATGSNNTCVGHNAGAGVSTNNYSNNSFFGYYAGKGATTGGSNSFMGYYAGATNTTGFDDVAVGANALYLNTTGQYNVAIGKSSMYSNTVGYHNTANGLNSLYSNTTGDANVAIGNNSLYTTSTANNNTACGYDALRYTTSSNSTGVGFEALKNTTGTGNTGLGKSAGVTNTTGTYNTFTGYGADANANNYTNSGSFGNGAIVTASNQIYMGNASVSGLYNATGVYTTSDGRFKSNVTENVKGLAFINELRPVTYKLETKIFDDFIIQNMPDSIKTAHQAGMDFVGSTAIIHSGFIAQEVEAAALLVGFTSSIVSTPDNSADPYALNYAEIVVPLVKAVQELSKGADSTQAAASVKDSINESKLDALQNQVNQLLETLNACCSLNHSMQTNDNSNSGSSIDVNLKDGQSVILEQNVPNPFAEQTTINYFLPENVVKAQMLFYNVSGKLIQSVDLNGKGKGSINVFAQDLSNGTYTYTIVVDGKIMETKKMVKQ